MCFDPFLSITVVVREAVHGSCASPGRHSHTVPDESGLVSEPLAELEYPITMVAQSIPAPMKVIRSRSIPTILDWSRQSLWPRTPLSTFDGCRRIPRRVGKSARA